jgi:predicted component of type VI protein secretion system
MRQIIQSLDRLLRRAGRSRNGRMSPEQLAKLARQLEQTQETEYSCEDVFRLLDRFAESVRRGEDAAKLMPLVQHHLDLCPDCREEFEALMRVLRAKPA